MTYGELKAQFEALLNRSDITSALTILFINQALTRAQRELRVPSQEKTQTTAVTVGFTGIDVPSDYIAPISLMVDDHNVQYLPVSRFLELSDTSTGQPVYWTRINSQIVMKPLPPEDSEVSLYYYGEFTPFTTDNGSTILSTIAPDLIIYGALSYAADYYLDERTGAFEGRYTSIMQALQDQAYDADGPGVISPAYALDQD